MSLTPLDRVLERVVEVLRPYPFRGKARLLGKLVSRVGTRQADVFGVTMDLDLSEWIQWNIYTGDYEHEERPLVRRVLRPGATVVDVGANVGYFVALAAECVGPTGKIFAFEPSPYAFAHLQKLVASNALSQCTIDNIGLSDAPGRLALYLRESFKNHTPTMSRASPSRAADLYATVAVRTLDELVEERHIEMIDLLKIDVEGHEPRVLAGAIRAIAAGKIRATLIEFNDECLQAAGTSASRLAEELMDLGFRDPETRDGRPRIGVGGVCNRMLHFLPRPC